MHYHYISCSRIHEARKRSSFIFSFIFYFLILYKPKTAILTMNEGGYYVTVFILFLYTCTNPFIYAVKFDPVKCALKDLIFCRRTAVRTPTQSRSATFNRSLQLMH